MTVILIISLIYIFFNSLILNSIKRIFNFPAVKLNSKAKISVIIAAKNEEQNIPSLLNSLKKQSYSNELFEVIIIDDRSSDNTFEVIESSIKDLKNFDAYKIGNKKYPGKKGALQYGIEMAKNPYILITDADCQPENQWIESFARKFDSDSDFILGVAPLFQTKGLVNKLSCFENLRTFLMTFGAANLGMPYSAAARSFGFKRSSFESLEGYKNTTKTLSGDDDLLLREAFKHNMKIEIVANNDAMVYSATADSFSEYLKQKARHTSTSLHYLFIHKLILSLWHMINIFMLFSPLFLSFNNNFLILFFVKILGDIYLVSTLRENLNYKFNFIEIIFYQVIYEIMLIINFLNAGFRKIEWK